MSEITLSARRRNAGRSNARALRRQGIVPGVFYYHGEEPIAISATELDLRPLVYTSETHVVRMRLDDGVEKTCILKDISFDPISDRPTHFDLQGVAADEKMRVEVPILLVGQAIGQRDGGIVDHVLHKVEVSCLPGDLPEHIDVDITNLRIGDSIHVGDLKNDRLEFLQAEDATIVAVSHGRTTVEVEPQIVVGEPELIGKAKEE